MAPGGIALFHDTNLIGWPGYTPGQGVPPVRQALDEYCAETGLSWENCPASTAGGDPAVNPRLLDLLESGEFDWDDPRHREAYLRAWVKRAAARSVQERGLT